MSPVAAIVVSYEGEELLRGCLQSLERSLSACGDRTELVVVDNGSTDGSARMVRERFPSAELVVLTHNRGFGAAVNEGLARCSAEWVFLLNNDATVVEGAVGELLRVAAQATPDVGSIAAQTRFADHSERINSAGLQIDWLGVAADRLLGSSPDAGGSGTVEVFGTSAGAALYRRSMLEQLGGFDERFFVFLEDADLAWRARMGGWRALYAPAAVVHHVHSATSVHNSPFKHFHVGRNRVRLIAKNADPAHLRRWGAAMVLYDLAYVAYATVADRTLAPLRGRLSGLRGWRAARSSNAAARRPVQLAPVAGVRGALRRRAAWGGADGDGEPE